MHVLVKKLDCLGSSSLGKVATPVIQSALHLLVTNYFHYQSILYTVYPLFHLSSSLHSHSIVPDVFHSRQTLHCLSDLFRTKQTDSTSILLPAHSLSLTLLPRSMASPSTPLPPSPVQPRGLVMRS